jgi:hypothetical protein
MGFRIGGALKTRSGAKKSICAVQIPGGMNWLNQPFKRLISEHKVHKIKSSPMSAEPFPFSSGASGLLTWSVSENRSIGARPVPPSCIISPSSPTVSCIDSCFQPNIFSDIPYSNTGCVSSHSSTQYPLATPLLRQELVQEFAIGRNPLSRTQRRLRSPHGAITFQQTIDPLLLDL